MEKKRKKRRYHTGVYTSLKSGKTWKYRSGWELAVMKRLDVDVRVVSWTYEQIVIEYVSNNRTKKRRRYYPDFFVEYSDGSREIIEVKQSRKLTNPTVVKKAEAAKSWCESRGMTYVIITEVCLKSMGLLL